MGDKKPGGVGGGYMWSELAEETIRGARPVKLIFPVCGKTRVARGNCRTSVFGGAGEEEVARAVWRLMPFAGHCFDCWDCFGRLEVLECFAIGEWGFVMRASGAIWGDSYT